MHTAAKVLLIFGVISTVIGVVGFAIGAGQLDDLKESWDTFEYEGATNGTITIEDKDGFGDLGVTFWVKGVYEDNDENNQWDFCDSTIINITVNPEVNKSWDDAEERNGSFYYEVMSEEGCKSESYNKDTNRSENGLVKVGRACWGCYSGELSFESNQEVWVTYDDKIFEEMEEDGTIVALGFAGGFGGICCGVLLLIIGVVLALTMNDKKNEMMYMPPAGNMMVSNSTTMTQKSGVCNDCGLPGTMCKCTDTAPKKEQITPTTTHMSAPSFDEPKGGGI